jgi:hypothetical protein
MTDDTPDRLLPELDRLDPWSFWVASGEEFGADRIVIGTTGAFILVVTQEEGYVNVSLGKVKIGGKPVASVKSLKRKARKLKNKLSGMAVYADVAAVICPTNAILGGPRDVKGVWVAKPTDAVKVISRRANVIPRQTAKRAAQALGAKMRSVRPDSRDS